MAESSAAEETPEPTMSGGVPGELDATTIANDTRPEAEPAVAEQEEAAQAQEIPLSDGEAPTEKLPRVVIPSSHKEEETAIEEPLSLQDEVLEESSSPEEMPTLVEHSSPEERALEEPALEEMPTLVEQPPTQKLAPAVGASSLEEAMSPLEPATTEKALPEPAVAKEEQPEVLRVPSQSLSGLYRTLLGLASLTSGIASITINQLLLPSQIATLDPAHQSTSLLQVAIAGILAAFIAAPLAGAFSDRTSGRFGRRRPWMLVGLIGGVASLLLMAFSTSVLLLLVGEVLMQIFFSFVYTMLTAVIPDQVPLRQRAIVSAAVGIAPVIGSVIGLVVVSVLASGTRQGYFWLAAITFVVVALFLLMFREKPLPHGVMPRFHVKTFFVSFWHNPKRHPNFTLVWFSRSFLFLSYTLFILYLLSYLVNVLHLAIADATLRMLIFQIISTGTLLVFAFLSPLLADRLQRLKLFIVLGTAIMAGGVFLVAFMPLWQYILLASGLFGIGAGSYLAVGLALTIRVLPQARDHGKDLGIMNITLYLALIVAPLLAGVILNFASGYTVLFALAGGAALLAGGLIIPMRGVR